MLSIFLQIKFLLYQQRSSLPLLKMKEFYHGEAGVRNSGISEKGATFLSAISTADATVYMLPPILLMCVPLC